MDTTPYIKFAKEVLGVEFHDLELLITAFTHRSYLNEHKKSVKAHNERLEFLGDAVLELITSDYLYTNYDEPEGILTNWRASLVRTESIAAVAAKLDYESLLRLSRGEKRGTDRARRQILANTFEAVLGALYLDQGYEAARKFVTRELLVTLEAILASGSWVDPKSKLQELAQSQDGFTPSYRVLTEEGPDHDKTFTVGAYVGETLKAKGVGPSKQVAQQDAAKKALGKYEQQ